MGYESFLLPPDETVVLPSGMGRDPAYPVILRHPTSKYFMSLGQLPSILSRSVLDDRPQQDIEAEIKEEVGKAISDGVDYTDQTNLLICDVFVTPRFSLDPHNGELHPNRLQLADRTFVLRWATEKMKSIHNGGADSVSGFPEKPGAGAVVVEGGKGVQ